MKKEFGYVASNSYPESPSSAAHIPELVLPRSIEMFGDILTLIIARKFDLGPEEIGHAVYIHEDGSFAIGFCGYHENLSEERGFSDPDQYEAVREMLSDLRVVSNDKNIRINPDKLHLLCNNKIALHKAICELIDTEEYDLDTIDNVTLMREDGPADSQLIQEMSENPKKYAEIFLDAGYAELDPVDPRDQHMIFLACRASHGVSRIEEFYLDMIKAQEADIPLSLDHLLRVIWEEDKCRIQELAQDSLIVGGYH